VVAVLVRKGLPALQDLVAAVLGHKVSRVSREQIRGPQALKGITDLRASKAWQGLEARGFKEAAVLREIRGLPALRATKA
jgi:hypothetical protein